jgi:hypothetical protein
MFTSLRFRLRRYMRLVRRFVRDLRRHDQFAASLDGGK